MAKSGKKSPITNSPKSPIDPTVFSVANEINRRLELLKKKTGKSQRINKVTSEDMKFVTKWFETGDIIEAALYAYPKVKNKWHAQNLGVIKLDKPAVNQTISEIMKAREDFSDDKLLQRISDIVYRSDNESNAVSLIKEVLKIKGAYAPERVVNVNVNQDISRQDDDEFLETIKEFAAGEDRFLREVSDRNEEEGASLTDELTDGDGEETWEK